MISDIAPERYPGQYGLFFEMYRMQSVIFANIHMCKDSEVDLKFIILFYSLLQRD